MSVNKNFYTTINSLVQQASSGALTATDYSSFVDAGKAITNLTAVDLQNNFVSALMNKIALSIDTFRSYEGAYKELVRGNVGMGNTIEMIMHTFYQSQAPLFGAALPENGQSVDMYTVLRPEIKARYFTLTNSYTIQRTIERTELAKAFESPAAMDSFIAGITGYMINSNERTRETGRVGMVARGISTAYNVAPTSDTNKNAVHYNLREAFQTEVDETFDPEQNKSVAEYLNHKPFVLYAISVIKKIGDRMTKVSNKFNPNGEIETFTPIDKRHLFITSALETAMDTYIYNDNYRPDRSMLKDYISVPYWQSEDAPFSVEDNSSEDTTNADGVICYISDIWGLGEYVQSQTMDTTPYNARGKFWNSFLNVETRYIINPDANMVVFTI